MKIYTVERLDKFDYDFSVMLKKCGCFYNRDKALQKARQVYETMCGEYEDEMQRYADEEDKASGETLTEEDAENGYYLIAFGHDEDYECHSVAVEEYEIEDEQREIDDGEWFGVVRWCEKDLVGALRDQGLSVTENNIAKLYSLCDKHWFTDHMVSAGWEYMYNVIDNENGWEV